MFVTLFHRGAPSIFFWGEGQIVALGLWLMMAWGLCPNYWGPWHYCPAISRSPHRAPWTAKFVSSKRLPLSASPTKLWKQIGNGSGKMPTNIFWAKLRHNLYDTETKKSLKSQGYHRSYSASFARRQHTATRMSRLCIVSD